MQVARYKLQVFRKEEKRMDSHFRGNDKEECGNDRGGGGE